MEHVGVLCLCFGLSVYLATVASDLSFSVDCSRNCTFVEENSPVSCTCNYDADLTNVPCGIDVGAPTGIDSMKKIVHTVTKADDSAEVQCLATTSEISLVVPVVTNIPFGPDEVTLQSYSGYDERGQPFVLFNCHPSEMNPMNPDMVSWTGACEEQTEGFTCKVDPRVLKKDVSCTVNNHHDSRVTPSLPIDANFIINPSPPFLDCSEFGSYIPEHSRVPCVCKMSNFGVPSRYLVWATEDRTILKTETIGVTELRLHPGVLTRANDKTQLLCEARGTESTVSVTLPLHIAYGPDMVDLQMYHGVSDSGEPFVVFYCQVNGMNPLTPDMVQWLGACEDQEGGFTCQVDPRVVTTEVGCRVINRYNNDLQVDSKKMKPNFRQETSRMQAVRRRVAGTVSGVILVLLAGFLITVYFCRKRIKTTPNPTAKKTGNEATQFKSSPWQYQRDPETDPYIVGSPFQRY